MDEDWRATAKRMVSEAYEITWSGSDEESVVFGIAGDGAGERFAGLVRRLEGHGIACSLERTKVGGVVVAAFQIPERRKRWTSSAHVPRALFAAVVALVMVDGYYRTDASNGIIFIGDPLIMAAVYTLSLLGILGVHEMGHIAASRIHKVRTSWPYFLPGIPIYGIPTFGAFIQSRGLTANRLVLFDIAIAGPLAGLAVAIAVSLFAASEAPVIPDDLDEEIQGRLSDWGQGESLFMRASLAAFGKGGEGAQVLMTPVLFASWVGFLLTFLNLLPAWQLDGGHMARTLLGRKWHKYATYASMGVLAALGYWFMAIFILVLSSRNEGARPLDDLTPLPRSRKAAYAITMGLAVLCAPLPAWMLP